MNELDNAFAILGARKEAPVPDGFMDGVWMRAGQLEEISARRSRLALLATMTFIGLGAGFASTQTPANAEPVSSVLVEGADLSPAALLHVEP